MNSTPASKINAHWPITATIWRNENNEGKAWYSVAIERRYKDSAGNFKTTNTFSGEELLVVAKVADLAHTDVARLKAVDRAAQDDERTPGDEG